MIQRFLDIRTKGQKESRCALKINAAKADKIISLKIITATAVKISSHEKFKKPLKPIDA